MEERLTEKEVRHVADLARIYVSEKEIAKYQTELKKLLDDIEKIKDVKNYDREMMFSPVEHQVEMKDDEADEMITFEEIEDNLPRHLGNFVEVPVMINE